MRPLISFDWAIKRLLRQKANFSILEGFLSELLKEDISIISIPESEGNGAYADDKVNKVDILCETNYKKIILVELQYNSENDYFHRMLFGASKIVTDYLHKGDSYNKVRKVISVNILYFDLGHGNDYIYHGTTEFKGIHTHDPLQLTVNQKKLYNINNPSDIFAEYYILKVNKFNDVAKDSLDEWMYYFKNNKLPISYSARGLDMVAKKLNYDDMTKENKMAFDAHQKELAITYGVLETAKFEGREEGMIKGIEKGIEKEIEIVVINGFKNGIEISLLATITDQPREKVISILRNHSLI